jgi:hypothetical protein
MTTYTETELRAKDAFCATHVMGWELWIPDPDCPVYRTGDTDSPTQKWFKPTTKSASAMKVLQKCAEKSQGFRVCIWKGATTGLFFCGEEIGSSDIINFVKAPTLELAIVLFAEKVFGTSTTP